MKCSKKHASPLTFGKDIQMPGRLPRVQQRGPLPPSSPGSPAGSSEGRGGAGAGGDRLCSLCHHPSSRSSGTAGRHGCVGLCATPPPGPLSQAPFLGGRRAQWGEEGPGPWTLRAAHSGPPASPLVVFIPPCPHASQEAKPQPEPNLQPMYTPSTGIKPTALQSVGLCSNHLATLARACKWVLKPSQHLPHGSGQATRSRTHQCRVTRALDLGDPRVAWGPLHTQSFEKGHLAGLRSSFLPGLAPGDI